MKLAALLIASTLAVSAFDAVSAEVGWIPNNEGGVVRFYEEACALPSWAKAQGYRVTYSYRDGRVLEGCYKPLSANAAVAMFDDGDMTLIQVEALNAPGETAAPAVKPGAKAI